MDFWENLCIGIDDFGIEIGENLNFCKKMCGIEKNFLIEKFSMGTCLNAPNRENFWKKIIEREAIQI